MSDLGPASGSRHHKPKSTEPGFTEADWKNAVLVGSERLLVLPTLPPDNHFLAKLFAGALESTAQDDLGLALPPAVHDKLVAVCIKACHINRLFPFEAQGAPPLLVLHRELAQGPRPNSKAAKIPYFRREFYRDIGDAVLAGLSFLKGFLDIGLHHSHMPTHEAGLRLGQEAYIKAGALPDEPYSDDSAAFRLIAENLHECVVILSLAYQNLLCDQRKFANMLWLPRAA